MKKTVRNVMRGIAEGVATAAIGLFAAASGWLTTSSGSELLQAALAIGPLIVAPIAVPMLSRWWRIRRLERARKRAIHRIGVDLDPWNMGAADGRPVRVSEVPDSSLRVGTTTGLTLTRRSLEEARSRGDIAFLASLPTGAGLGELEAFLDYGEIAGGELVIPLDSKADAAELNPRFERALKLADSLEQARKHGHRTPNLLALALDSDRPQVRAAAARAWCADYFDHRGTVDREDLHRLLASEDDGVWLAAAALASELPWQRLLDLAADGARPAVQRLQALDTLGARPDLLKTAPAELAKRLADLVETCHGEVLHRTLDVLGTPPDVDVVRRRFWALNGKDQQALLESLDPLVQEHFRFIEHIKGSKNASRRAITAAHQILNRTGAGPLSAGGLATGADVSGGGLHVDEGVHEGALAIETEVEEAG